MTYTIGDHSEVIGGYYSFVEIGSDCDYVPEITFSGLPDFIVHNTGSQDFTIPATNDLALAGVYEVLITSKITYLTSATDLTPIEFEATVSLTITLINPCLST